MIRNPPSPRGHGAQPYMSSNLLFGRVNAYSSCQCKTPIFLHVDRLPESEHGIPQKVLCVSHLTCLLSYNSVLFIFVQCGLVCCCASSFPAYYVFSTFQMSVSPHISFVDGAFRNTEIYHPWHGRFMTPMVS